MLKENIKLKTIESLINIGLSCEKNDKNLERKPY